MPIGLHVDHPALGATCQLWETVLSSAEPRGAVSARVLRELWLSTSCTQAAAGPTRLRSHSSSASVCAKLTMQPSSRRAAPCATNFSFRSTGRVIIADFSQGNRQAFSSHATSRSLFGLPQPLEFRASRGHSGWLNRVRPRRRSISHAACRVNARRIENPCGCHAARVGNRHGLRACRLTFGGQ